MDQFIAQRNLIQNPPPIILIDCRMVAVNGPEAISKALCDAVTSQDVLLQLSNFPDLVKAILDQLSVTAEAKTSVGNISVKVEKLAEYLKKDEKDLTETIKK